MPAKVNREVIVVIVSPKLLQTQIINIGDLASGSKENKMALHEKKAWRIKAYKQRTPSER